MGKKLTKEEVIERIKEVHGDTISLVGDYKNANTSTTFRCNAGLGHPDWNAKTSNVINKGSGCMLCSTKQTHSKQKKSIDDAQKELDEKYKGSISIVKYGGAKNKSVFHCNRLLGHKDWEGNLYSLIYDGKGCPECKKLNYYRNKEPLVKNEVYKYSNGEISMVGTFRGNNVKTKFRCNKGLGHKDWEATPGQVLKGRTCHECHKFGKKLAKEYYKEFLEAHKDGNVSLVSNYVDNDTYVELQCNIDSTHPSWKTSPYNGLKHNSRCPICTNKAQGEKQRNPDSYYIKKALPYVFGRGAILGIIRSKGSNGKEHAQLRVICSKCGNEWELPLSNLMHGQWCYNCASPRLESLVANVLEVNEIEYKREYSVIVDGEVNRLDFIIQDTPRGDFVIEADGRQHWDKDSNYYRDNYPIKDAQKNEWCKNNGYTMLRIDSDNTSLPHLIEIMEDNMGYSHMNKPSITRCPSFKREHEIANYYLNHSSNETCIKYHVVRATVEREFKRVFGVAKKDYLIPSEKDVAEYYLNHSVKETMNQFSIGSSSVTRFFRRYFKCTKGEYLKEMGKNNAGN